MNEAEQAGRIPMPSVLTPGMDCAKEARPRDGVSYIEHAPENQVVLSQRLEHLARRIGGCQTDELLALVRRIMFEVISQRKY